MIIGISGRIGSGKDTVGKIIQYLICLELNTLAPHQFSFKDFVKSTASNEIQSGFKIKKFADKLKDLVCMLIGCTREQLEDREFKEKELGEEWDRVISSDGKVHLPDDYPDLEYSKLTPRLLLQLLGTEYGREIIHPNIWVNSLMSEYFCVQSDLAPNGIDCPNWIITDMRFPNEMEAVKKKGGITIRVNRPCDICGGSGYHKMSCPVSKSGEHYSEKALDNAEFDYVIDNNGTIEELIVKIKDILIERGVL